MPAPAGAQIVLGAVAFGKPKPTTRDHPLSSDEACSELLTAFAAHGGRELDTARIYQNGNCEAMLGRLPSARQLRIATKFHPTGMPGTITEQLDQSLVALNRDSVEIFYPHMPATDSDLEKTLAELNACHRAGKFVELGLSNYPAWQVVEVCMLCKHRGWVRPTVYQGVYNALNRTAEYELVPVLRNFGLRYYTHGSLASGFLTGKYRKGVPPTKGVDRFAQSRRVKQYQERYLNHDEMFDALGVISAASADAGISVLEAAVRWTQHHSAVDATRGDSVLIGVSRIAQLEPIMLASKRGPLPEAVVEAFDRAHDCVKMKSEYYLQYPYPKEGQPFSARL